MTYRLAGVDANRLSISETGEISIENELYYQTPSDVNKDNQYDFDVIATAGNSTATVNIALTVEGYPIVSIKSDNTPTEGKDAVFTIYLDKPSAIDAEVTYKTSPGAAEKDVDYTHAEQSITISSGQTSATVSVQTLDDALDEANETFSLELMSAQKSNLGEQYLGETSIMDDDPEPLVSFAKESQNTYELSTNTTISVTLSEPSSFDVTVPFTVTGTAQAGINYENLTAFPLTILAGETKTTITLSPIEDSDEQEQSLTFTMGVPTYADNGTPDSHTLTIKEGKTPPITNTLGQTFNYIEPGTFMMGSPSSESGRGSDETQHQVTLTKGFYMQTTEVTQGQWKAIMGSNPSRLSSCGDDCPVETVGWNDIQTYITKLNQQTGQTYRLPTEAEWEYAARAGTTTAYHFGDSSSQLGDYAWYYDNNSSSTHPVAKKKPNDWGLYDMHGNVWEWVNDWYDSSYSSSPETDPQGPGSSSDRVVRGGSWYNYAQYARSACRSSSA